MLQERGVGIQDEVAGKTETNRTKLEHFVNVHQITFEKTCKMRSEDHLRFVFSFSKKDWMKWSPADGVVQGVVSCL